MIVCRVCSCACRLEEGKTGYCGVRTNIDGENKDVLFGRLRIDLELGRVFATLPGCNLQCPYCLYPRDSKPGGHMTSDTEYPILQPVDLMNLAAAMKAPAITLSGGEPTLHYEYLLEVSRLCREKGVKTIMLTNGFINSWLAEKLGSNIDLVPVGVKGGLSKEHYAEMNADPEVVRQSIRIFWIKGKATIIAYLVDPKFRSTREDDKRFALWLSENTSPNIRIDLEYLHHPKAGVMAYPLPENPEKTWRFIQGVAGVLRENGLTNIWTTDIPTFKRTNIPQRILLHGDGLGRHPT